MTPRGTTTAPSCRPRELPRQPDPSRVPRSTREVMAQPVLARFIKSEYVPKTPLRTRDDYRQFVRREAHAALHPVGTSRMGTDAMAVLDADLRVRGLAGLRVADTSVMPTLCSGNTNAAAIMIGEKAADHIRGP